MTPESLFAAIRKKRSLLCVGLDTDPRKLPPHLLATEDPVFEFNRQIVEATAAYAVAYKPNLAFYEAQGPKGWESLRKTLAIVPDDCFTIADAKRGDIGNTSDLYARTFFETYDFDAVTVAPYMGHDSVTPFLKYPGKWVFLLALTSNEGALDFQLLETEGAPLHQKVITTALAWAKDLPGHLGFVVGATRPEHFATLRKLAPESFFLVPGIGAQGGDLAGVCANGLNTLGGLLVNSSRGILYAGSGLDFAAKAAEEAQKLQEEMAVLLESVYI
jgi:orotidine-5'-phosphate decarboxylase